MFYAGLDLSRKRLDFSSARRRGCLAADDRGGLVDELVVLEGLHHEQGEVDAAREVALEDGIAHVPTPHRQAVTLALLEVAPTDDGPSRVAGKHPPTGLHLVVEVGEASQTRERPEHLHDRLAESARAGRLAARLPDPVNSPM